jgi:hypothetical protein
MIAIDPAPNETQIHITGASPRTVDEVYSTIATIGCDVSSR